MSIPPNETALLNCACRTILGKSRPDHLLWELDGIIEIKDEGKWGIDTGFKNRTPQRKRYLAKLFLIKLKHEADLLRDLPCHWIMRYEAGYRRIDDRYFSAGSTFLRYSTWVELGEYGTIDAQVGVQHGEPEEFGASTMLLGTSSRETLKAEELGAILSLLPLCKSQTVFVLRMVED